LKIHIVQKGDTLWEISKQYGVDFEELKSINSQLSNPEMIMPGMKIKIPGQTKHVKSEQKHHSKNQMMPPKAQVTPPKGQMTPPPKAVPAKEKPIIEKPPLKAMPTVPAPIIQPDDIKPIEPIQPVQPQMPIYQAPEMPKIEFDMTQNQIFQQAQQAPQAPIMMPQLEQPKAPVQEQPAPQPVIQILPVYFYPIMQPTIPPVMPPQQHQSPCNPCAPIPSPYESYPVMPQMQAMPYHEQYHNYEPMMHGHGYEHMMTDCMSNSCAREDQQNLEDHANGMPLASEEREQLVNNEQQEELNTTGSYFENAGQPHLSPEHTYYEPAPRYFNDHNFYSPHQQAPYTGNEQAGDGNLNQANLSPEQRQEPNQF